MAGKKTFKGTNPALQFIDRPAEAKEAEGAGPFPLQEKQEKQDRQTKSKHVHLLLRPATAEAMEKLAFIHKTSVNDLVNSILQEYVTAHTDDITTYEQIQKMINERSNNK